MKVSQRLYMSLIYLLLYTPIAIVVIFSFNNSSYSQLWHGFTLNWYQVLFHDSNLIQVTWHSLVLGISAATFTTLLAMIGATALARYRFPGKNILNTLIFILILLPDIVIAVSFTILFRVLHFPLGFWSLFIAHVTLSFPFAISIVYSQIRGFSPHLFEAAKDLGATESIIFRKLVIPLMAPAMIAAWLLCFTLSLDDVVISYFVSGPNFNILPLQIFSLVKVGVKPEINALSTMLLALTVILVLISQTMLNKREKSQ